MKQNTYKVWFTNGNYDRQSELVGGFNAGEAIILAQAIRIKEGKDYTVESVEQLPE